MKILIRILVFGSLSGLLWSVVPGILTNLFDSRGDVPATLLAGVVAGLITSFALVPLIARRGLGLATCLGLLSLPLGAFVFGFGLALIDRLLPTLASGSRAVLEPWNLGLNYAVLSSVSVFAIGLFPLAVTTTLLLRRLITRGRIVAGAASP